MALQHRQGIEFDLVLFQHVQSRHDPLESRLLSFVDAVTVVELARTVNRDPYEKSVGSKKFSPLVVYEDPVSLEGISNALAVRVLLLQLQRATKEIDAHKGRFPALPGKVDRRYVLRRYVLGNVLLEHIVAHAPGLVKVWV